MRKADLQKLSAQVITALPANVREAWGAYRHCIMVRGPDNVIVPQSLHDSTDACVYILLHMLGGKALWAFSKFAMRATLTTGGSACVMVPDCDGDLTLAFRVTILEAFLLASRKTA